MSIPTLTEATLREHTAEGSFERGERYYEDGAVREVSVEAGELEAFVQGSEPSPYTVTVDFDQGGVQKVHCTCPFHEGSWCKHIVAALLAHLRGGAGDEASRVRRLLEGQDREELVALLAHLCEHDDRVYEWVEEEVA